MLAGPDIVTDDVSALRFSVDSVRIDGIDLRVEPIASSRPNPVGVAFDGANVWVGANDKVYKLRAIDGANLGSFAVGASAVGVVFDGANIWVSSYSQSNVTKLR